MKEDIFMKECRKLIKERLEHLKFEELKPFVQGVRFGMSLSKRIENNVIIGNMSKNSIKGES